jgi:hypothetical protein
MSYLSVFRKIGLHMLKSKKIFLPVSDQVKISPFGLWLFALFEV